MICLSPTSEDTSVVATSSPELYVDPKHGILDGENTSVTSALLNRDSDAGLTTCEDSVQPNDKSPAVRGFGGIGLFTRESRKNGMCGTTGKMESVLSHSRENGACAVRCTVCRYLTGTKIIISASSPCPVLSVWLVPHPLEVMITPPLVLMLLRHQPNSFDRDLDTLLVEVPLQCISKLRAHVSLSPMSLWWCAIACPWSKKIAPALLLGARPGTSPAPPDQGHGSRNEPDEHVSAHCIGPTHVPVTFDGNGSRVSTANCTIGYHELTGTLCLGLNGSVSPPFRVSAPANTTTVAASRRSFSSIGLVMTLLPCRVVVSRSCQGAGGTTPDRGRSLGSGVEREPKVVGLIVAVLQVFQTHLRSRHVVPLPNPRGGELSYSDGCSSSLPLVLLQIRLSVVHGVCLHGESSVVQRTFHRDQTCPNLAELRKAENNQVDVDGSCRVAWHTTPNLRSTS